MQCLKGVQCICYCNFFILFNKWCSCLFDVCCQPVVEHHHLLFLTGSCTEEITVFRSNLIEIDGCTPSTNTDSPHITAIQIY